MKAIADFRHDHGRDLTDPFPPKRSVTFRVVGGNWLDPVGFDNDWFKPPHPRCVIRLWIPLWFSWALLIASTALLVASLFAPWWASLLALVAWIACPGKFFAWRWDDRGGYFGSKIYGVDAPIYANWLCDPSEVYPGSLAFCQSIRLCANLEGRP